jgi:hypothetical protein
MAAHLLRATHDSAELLAARHQVDPAGVLPPEERARCVKSAWRAHMASAMATLVRKGGWPDARGGRRKRLDRARCARYDALQRTDNSM